MRTNQKKPDREAIAKSLRELAILWGLNDKGREQAANAGANQSESQGNDTTTAVQVQAVFGGAP